MPKNIECMAIRTVLLHHSIPGGLRISTRALKTASFFHKFVYTACRFCQPWFHTIVSETGITNQDRYFWYFDGSFVFSCYFWVQTKNRSSQDIPTTVVKHQIRDFVQKWVLVRRGLLIAPTESAFSELAPEQNRNPGVAAASRSPLYSCVINHK